ncbi:isocitrate lyase/phosphoenolpyruvate mutase family protein [Amnibacterium sp. CER49]|uniref:isocitrate lyase/PEP mutase family protein n=1 Tax=Amnibacterium sp. CER49 TaxID=3039161 RepID=UPI00244A7875|nr:isocitrate lyase/phosphoenolpyruvate mutase family protein [Amnibacterium sp. CER49]MDH2445212.1 isocitrate lyase/phosphoenolpyruvate mutase family protein [Amnibacterium sp. CER49]
MDIAARAQTLRDLHAAPDLLSVVNVWDVISATTVAGVSGVKALATAGHSIAATFGYPDGEVPLETTLDLVGRIVAAVDVPVSADLDNGYADPGETIRRAIGVGVVGANMEDRLVPRDEAVARVRAAVRGAEAEGVPFSLNARTDAFVRMADADQATKVDEALARGRAFLEEGATTVFVPGLLDESAVTALVEGLGPQRLAVINVPGSLPPSRLQQLGVARVSYGPWTQRVALHALQRLADDLTNHDGALPPGTPALN